MQFWKWIRSSAAVVAVSGLLIPAPCLAETAAEETLSARLVDVALEEGNILRGFVVDSAGQASEEVNVLLFHQQQLVASGISGERGEFAIANVRGGFYQIAAGDQVRSLRCWAFNTAPPTAKHTALLQIDDVQRGQIHPASCALANPWVIAGIAAAAIAIPITLKSHRDDRSDGS